MIQPDSALDKPNRRILIIDDNEAIHADFRKVLGQSSAGNDVLAETEAALYREEIIAPIHAGYELDSATQGRAGYECVLRARQEGRPYAMAFVDMRMPPGWDGVETITKIWEIDQDLQVVICTAFSDCSWEEIIAKVGQSDRLVILKKPFDMVEVRQLANAFVVKWHLLQQVRSHISELEERVRERTQAIEQAHLDLQKEIADRNRMESQLRHGQKMESIGQLTAGIAHEINTPTQYIGDNTRFLRDEFGNIRRLLTAYEELLGAAETGTVTPELIRLVKAAGTTADVAYLGKEIPKAIQQSLDGLESVAKIIRSMKDFSHPGTKEKIPLDLNRSIESTLTVCRSEWKYVADLRTDYDVNLPPVPCLPGEFNQAVLNIIINATHAIMDVVGDGSKTKGTITVSTRLDGEWAEVRISDTGTGIPEHVRTRIFDPFFTTKGIGKGTGQGLGIAHAVVVQRHGGTIDFETETGKGTTFVIRLPLLVPTETT